MKVKIAFKSTYNAYSFIESLDRDFLESCLDSVFIGSKELELEGDIKVVYTGISLWIDMNDEKDNINIIRVPKEYIFNFWVM